MILVIYTWNNDYIKNLRKLIEFFFLSWRTICYTACFTPSSSSHVSIFMVKLNFKALNYKIFLLLYWTFPRIQLTNILRNFYRFKNFRVYIRKFIYFLAHSHSKKGRIMKNCIKISSTIWAIEMINPDVQKKIGIFVNFCILKKNYCKNLYEI